jgi:Rrf2 family protein
MRISAKVDYAVRVCAELAAAEPGVPIKGETLASAQDIPLHFMENILRELRRADIVRTVRGAVGGYMLAQPANAICVADIIRAVEGPLAAVQGVRPESVTYEGSAAALTEVWIAVRASLRGVLETVTVADIASNTLPRNVTTLANKPGAWDVH